MPAAGGSATWRAVAVSPAARFWAAALGVAGGIAATAAAVLPAALGTRAWLLAVWTAGVLFVLFGAAALLGAGVGVRDVLEAGSAPAAAEVERRRRSVRGEGFHRDMGWWTVATGGVLVAIYFLGWLILN